MWYKHINLFVICFSPIDRASVVLLFFYLMREQPTLALHRVTVWKFDDFMMSSWNEMEWESSHHQMCVYANKLDDNFEVTKIIAIININQNKARNIRKKKKKRRRRSYQYSRIRKKVWARWKIRKCNVVWMYFHHQVESHIHIHRFLQGNRLFSLNNWKLHFHSPIHSHTIPSDII